MSVRILCFEARQWCHVAVKFRRTFSCYVTPCSWSLSVRDARPWHCAPSSVAADHVQSWQFDPVLISVNRRNGLWRHHHAREDRLYIAFVYGLGVLGQKQAKRGKRRIGENLETTKGTKTSTTGQNSCSELQNRCSTTELNWLTDLTRAGVETPCLRSDPR